MDIESEALKVAELSNDLIYWKKRVTEDEEAFEEATLLHKRTLDAQEFLQRMAQAVQQQAHQKISHIVTAALRSVFQDDPYEFKIEFDRKRGRTEAVLLFTRNGVDVDPLTASGGGAINVAAFALRIACLMLHRPRLSRLVVLDEPFTFVSEEYRGNVRSMLEGLAKEMDLQIIMVTHIRELEIGKTITL